MPDLSAIIAQYKPRLDSLSARLYNSAPWEDTLLLKWWLTLQETGDIYNLINPDARKLRTFLKVFEPPTALLYTTSPTKENGIENAAWFTPVDAESKHRAAHSGLFLSTRASRHSLLFTALAYELAFEFYQSIIGTTWQPSLLDEHIKLGYTVSGCIPHLYDQPFCYIVHLTKEAFMQSRFMQLAQKANERNEK